MSHLRPVQLSLLITLAACLGGCPTDDAPGDDDFVPFVPDMADDSPQDVGHDDGAPDAPADAPLDAPDDSAPDQPPPDMTVDMPPTGCRPNQDGVITRAEVPLQAGLSATFRVAQDAPVNTAGEVMGDLRRWDVSAMLPGDRRTIVEAIDPSGFWFSNDFPDADYVTQLSASADLLGIFQITDDQLLLLGVASPADGFTSTRLTYDPPVTVLQFPLSEGSSWSTEASVTGRAQGVAVFYSERYTSQIDARGEIVTPFASFPTLRVRTDLSRTVGFLTTTTRTYLFTSECFGTVATIVSEDNESAVEFDTAAEVRRLAP